MKKLLFSLLTVSVILTCFLLLNCNANPVQFSFSVTGDMMNFTASPDQFPGACNAVRREGPGLFMVSVGDISPPWEVLSTIKDHIGQDYLWYPVVGNHEFDSLNFISWVRNYNPGGTSLPNIVRGGPAGSEETCYSFDYFTLHFVVLNEYYDGITDGGADGDVGDGLYAWLVNDLESNKKPIVLVFGHEPAYPEPDEESGRLRHENNSLNAHPANRDRFWNALKSYGVLAYICGHTHNYSMVSTDGVWQIDVGHARGTGDTGARSTFILFDVWNDGSVYISAFRLDLESGKYIRERAEKLCEGF
jgi:hypothetical protein